MEFHLHHVAETGSTMDLAKELTGSCSSGALIILADSQRTGKGRIEGRSWSGSPGASLLMTIGLKNVARDLAAFPLRVGLAAAEALRSSFPGLELKLKWPNDLLAQARSDSVAPFRKLGGILCEASDGWFFAGIGLNLGRAAYPDELTGRATCIDEALGNTSLGRYGPEMREALAILIGRDLLAFLARDSWAEAYLQSMWALGEEVEFRVGHPLSGQKRRGIIQGIEASGALVLKDETGETKTFSSGEISQLSVS
jgi:BirA family transcriptional regulator, biotin operon repressor / biotin---[acetyl-CoA-carboxylase] ligase